MFCSSTYKENGFTSIITNILKTFIMSKWSDLYVLMAIPTKKSQLEEKNLLTFVNVSYTLFMSMRIVIFFEN